MPPQEDSKPWMENNLPLVGWASTLITKFGAIILKNHATPNIEETARGGAKLRLELHKDEGTEK